MKNKNYYSALIILAVMLCSSVFYGCSKDDNSPATPTNQVTPENPTNPEEETKPDEPTNPEEETNPENQLSSAKAEEVSNNIKALAEEATDEQPIQLKLDSQTTDDDIKAVAEAITTNKDVKIEADFSKTSIKTIPADVFTDVDNLTSVTLPATVSEIGDNAFKDCDQLKTVVLKAPISKSGATLKIGASAFANCSALDSVITTTSNVEIDPTAFEGTQIDVLADLVFKGFADSKLAENVLVLAHVTEIPDSAFYKYEQYYNEEGELQIYVNTTLTSVTFAENSKLIRVGKSAFNHCESLKTLTLPEGLKEIDDYGLFVCASIQNFKLPQSIERVGDYACKSVNMGEDFNPTSIQNLGSNSFEWTDKEAKMYYCSVNTYDGKIELQKMPLDIENFEIPNTWSEIPISWSWAIFDNAYKNLKITFQEGSHIAKLVSYQFISCTFESIEISASVKEIEANVFTGNNYLKKITFENGSQIEKIALNAFVGWGGFIQEIHLPKFFELSSSFYGDATPLPEDVTVYVPADLVEQFKAADCYANCTILPEE